MMFAVVRLYVRCTGWQLLEQLVGLLVDGW